VVDDVDLGSADADGLDEDVVLPEASISRAACSVASERPPRAPRLAMERMKTPASRK
jgi:hypothetical protein